MKNTIYLIGLLLCLQCNSQTKKIMIKGEYYLQNEREIASGLRLNADKTFNFFFSSGGIDRSGKGIWELNKDTLILNSVEKPMKSFRLIDSKKIPGDSTTIKISDKNKMILGYVIYRINGADTIEGTTNEEGIAMIKKTIIASISLSHDLWPDKGASVFEITDKENNYFEFAIEKGISNLTFNNLKLVVKGDTLAGGHPMMPDGKFIYKKD